MFKCITLAAAAISLASCDAAAVDTEPTAKDSAAVEPTPREFRGVSTLTPEARTFLSQKISAFAGTKSVPDLKVELVNSILQVDYNENGLSQADFSRNFRENEATSRIRNMIDIFRSDDDGDGVVTKSEFDQAAAIKQVRHEKHMRAMADRFPIPVQRVGKDNQKSLGTMTAFRNADSNGDQKITLEEAYRVPKSESAKMYERAIRHSMGRQDVFALDFNDDKIVTKEEIAAGVDLFVQEANAEGINFPEVSMQRKPPSFDTPHRTVVPTN